jgi:hypothetical protein
MLPEPEPLCAPPRSHCVEKADDSRGTVTACTDTMDVVLEGTATRVTDEAAMQRVAQAYRAKYGWPVSVTGGAFDTPHGAPTAGRATRHRF